MAHVERSLRLHREGHEAVGLTDGKTPQDKGVEQAKHREVRTRAKPEDHEYDQGETRSTLQLTDRITKVVHQAARGALTKLRSG